MFDPSTVKINTKLVIIIHHGSYDRCWKYIPLAEKLNPLRWSITFFPPSKWTINNNGWMNRYSPKNLVARYRLKKLKQQ